MTYRNTYAKIKLDNITNNVKTIISNYSGYKYYIGVVKADTYGHNSSEVVKSIIDGGCNYLAVSSLDEALEIRKEFDTPILCLGIIDSKYIDICIENNIEIDENNLYANDLKIFYGFVLSDMKKTIINFRDGGENMEDTIAAIATTVGESSINVIRVSGNKSIEIVNKIFSRDHP